MPALIKSLLIGFLIIQLGGVAIAEGNNPSFEIHLGNIDNNTIMDGSGETALGLSMFFRPQSLHPNLGVYTSLWTWGTELPNTVFSSCLFCSVDNEVDVDLLAIGAGLTGIYAIERLKFYALAGLSYVRIHYKLGGSVFGIPGTVEENTDSELALQYGLGVVYATGDNSVGIHYRHFDMESSSDAFSVEDIDIGGDYLGLSFGWIY